MKANLQKLQMFLFVCIVSLAFSSVATAQEIDKKKAKEANKVARNASKAFDVIMASGSPIPQHVLDKAKAIGVFPGVVKVAFGFGGEGGKGLISRRVKDGWSVPAFFRLAGGSAGLQIGASETDFIMLFMTEDSLRKVEQDKFEIGGEAEVAAGPVGRTAGASTDATLQAGILSYSRSKGLFAGISLKGVALTADNNLNRAIYNNNAKGVLEDKDKLFASNSTVLAGIFPETLTKHSKK